VSRRHSDPVIRLKCRKPVGPNCKGVGYVMQAHILLHSLFISLYGSTMACPPNINL